MTPNGSTFKTEQAPFLTIDRPTDIDVDGQGRLYVSSWRNGSFTFAGENIGFVARVVPSNFKLEPFPDLAKANSADLLKYLASSSQVRRLATQREILDRGAKRDLVDGLEKLMSSQEPLPARVAAIYTYAQLVGAKAQANLLKLADDAEVREFALKALADRKALATALPIDLFKKSLLDPNPRVRLQAVIGLGRRGGLDAAAAIVPLVADADPLIAHIAIQVLASLDAVDVCVAALNQDNTKVVTGALRVLQALHEPKVVDSLLSRYDQAISTQRPAIFQSLCRLYFKEADWNGKWWGTRPDHRGPYFSPVTWSESARIGDYLKRALANAEDENLLVMLIDLNRNRLDFPEATKALLKLGANPDKRRLVVDALAARKEIPADAIPFLAEIASKPDQDSKLRGQALKALYRGGAGNEKALEAALRGFALVPDESKLGDVSSLANTFLHDNGHAKRLDVFVKAAQSAQAGEREVALQVLMNLATSKIGTDKVKAAAVKAVDLCMQNTETALSLLKAIRQTRAEEYAVQVMSLTKSTQPEVQKEALAVVKLLSLDRPRQDRKDAIKYLQYDDVLASAQKEKGDAAIGARLFVKQGCIGCHTVAKADPPKGPYLGDVANRYKRPELIESILKPSAKIAQGFESNIFVMANGKTLTGFVVREGGDEVDIRDGAGLAFTLKKADIDERLQSKVSIMPEQLVDTLTVPELASILAYLEELNRK